MLRSIPFYASLLGRELSSKTLSTNSHVLLYGAIEVHSFGQLKCIASNKTLAEDTGIGVTQIARLLKGMKDGGWIEYEFDKDNNRGVVTPLLNIATPPLRKTSTPPTKNVAIGKSIDTSTKVEGLDKPTKPKVNPIKGDVFGKKYGNREVNTMLDAISKLTPTGMLDGSEFQNRQRAHNLIQKYGFEPVLDTIKLIPKIPFWKDKVTSPGLLLKHYNAIISSLPAKGQDYKLL
jgi:hypothetical protein